MRLLAVDTSTRDLSLALGDGGRVIRYRNNISSPDLAKHFPSLLHKFLISASVPLKEVQGIIVGLGPGSFTGLRVGVASVKALAYSLSIPVTGISSLEAIAYGVKEQGERISVLVDARRNLFYDGSYTRKGTNVTQQGELHLANAKDVLKRIKAGSVVVGDGIPLIKEELARTKCIMAAQKFWRPQARYLIACAAGRLNEKTDSAVSLVPIYLYPEDCQVVRQEKKD